MADLTWIPLHVHSQYSILDSTLSLQAIADQAKAFGMPAVALTDHGNLYGAVEFFKACKGAGIKPIIGVEFYVAPHGREEKRREYSMRSSAHIILLAKNEIGYKNLCKLTSKGFLEGFYYHPRIDKSLLEEHKEGLICLSGCLNGPLAKEILQGDEASLQEALQFYRRFLFRAAAP
jgi:DNA polymerase-3 subunit alpha